MKILVCGLLAKHRTFAEAQCPPDVKLVFVDAERRGGRWAHLPRADKALVFTRFVSHRHIQALQRDGIPIQFFDFGVNSIGDVLKTMSAS